MRKIICIVLLAAVLLSPDLSAIQTLPTPVDGAAEAAADIVSCLFKDVRVEGNGFGKHTVYTCEITDAIKTRYKIGDTMTFKQPYQRFLPAYTKGEEYLIFLSGVSAEGNRTPIGLSHVYRVGKAADGSRILRSGINREMFRDVQKRRPEFMGSLSDREKELVKRQAERGAGDILNYDDFVSIVRKLSISKTRNPTR
ncbi:MAG: hypothetical protein A3I09_03560 [Deltaproteobacteria bacterium RIFCSPLOWO2_02_FULL_47_10]|nr:MAG: hypothetical protein A3I09_03560 [Deltaproteobacteria bacterium RIFCSPLOWO2_02_FULL_47_10]